MVVVEIVMFLARVESPSLAWDAVVGILEADSGVVVAALGSGDAVMAGPQLILVAEVLSGVGLAADGDAVSEISLEAVSKLAALDDDVVGFTLLVRVSKVVAGRLDPDWSALALLPVDAEAVALVAAFATPSLVARASARSLSGRVVDGMLR